MKCRKCNERVAEAAEAVDQNPFCGRCHVTLVCLVRVLRASWQRGCGWCGGAAVE
jgi:hypothetical protein